MIRQLALAALVFLQFAALAVAESEDLFALDGSQSIIQEGQLGIAHGRASIGLLPKTLGRVDGIWAPPLVSSNFSLSLRADNQSIAIDAYVWHPWRIRQTGGCDGLSVVCETTLLEGLPAFMLTLEISNPTDAKKEFPLAMLADGTLDRNSLWEFSQPVSASATEAVLDGPLMLLKQTEYAIALGLDAPGFAWDSNERALKGRISLEAGAKAILHLVVAIGQEDEARKIALEALRNPIESLTRSGMAYDKKVATLFERLPRFSSTNKALERLYNRSLVHLILNEWTVPEFFTSPYYSTGSIRGGCVCNYLWNFGEVWEILPLYNPEALKKHICQFLKNDITQHFALLPLDGSAWGPWYPVNQEKIIGLIYFQVLLNNDTAFLSETVAGKTILEWTTYHALVGDDPSSPVALYDYGPGNHHLELRRGYPYNHIMPDLNGRRYINYRRAWELSRIAGRENPTLLERADELKTVLKTSLWDDSIKWFQFMDPAGNKETRYTIQMYKLFGSGVLDKEQEEGLLSHLNEEEFLSEYGFHSMSKKDPAYDQVDIDNGGGGACTCFPPQIMERLWEDGYAAQAEEILKRILWWGERMPYWGDSIVANAIDYRKDTPLQCTLDGATVAQCLIFGLAGIQVSPQGAIQIKPRPLNMAESYELRGLRLLGRQLDISVNGASFTVHENGQARASRMGDGITLKPEEVPEK